MTTLEQNLNYFEKEELSINDRFNEYVLTRLRTIWGCDAEEIKLLFLIKSAFFRDKAALLFDGLNYNESFSPSGPVGGAVSVLDCSYFFDLPN